MSGHETETYAWIVESISGRSTTDPRPRLSLGENGEVTGSTGVNRFSGTYEAEGDLVRVTAQRMTRMAGTPEAMEQEGRFLEALEGWQAFRREDRRLVFGRIAHGMVLVPGRPAPPPERLGG